MDHLLQSYLTIMLVLKIIDYVVSVTQNITIIKSSPYPQSYMYYQPFLPSCPQSYYHVVPCPLSYHLVPSPTIKLSPYLPSCPQSYHQVVPFPTILSPVLPSSCPLSPFLPSCPLSYHLVPSPTITPQPSSCLLVPSPFCHSGVELFIFLTHHVSFCSLLIHQPCVKCK